MKANLDFLNPHNQPEPEKQKGYYCPHCEQYFYEQWYEINKYDAVDFYDIETEPCYHCEDNLKKENEEGLFNKLAKITKP